MMRHDVRFWHKADVPVALPHVRLGGRADITQMICHVWF
jgi:hypothetical protein